jgi:hypothetical protein
MEFVLTLLMLMQYEENYQAAKCVRERVIRKGMLNLFSSGSKVDSDRKSDNRNWRDWFGPL